MKVPYIYNGNRPTAKMIALYWNGMYVIYFVISLDTCITPRWLREEFDWRASNVL